MGDTIAHRGPDDSGVWCDNEADHQPMLSGSGRFVMAFSGDIYNFNLKNDFF